MTDDIDARERIIAALLFAGFCALYVLLGVSNDLQGDEVWTRLLVRLPFADVVPFMIRDGKHPPLYPLIQRPLGFFLPDSQLGLRALSIIAGASIPSVIFLAARRVRASVGVAMAIAIWIGSHPVIVAEAIKARSYALLVLLVLLYAVALLKYLESGNAKSVIASSALAAAAVVTHAFGVVYVGSLFLAAVAWNRLRSTRDVSVRQKALVLSIVLPAMLFTSWYGYVMFATSRFGGVTDGLQWVVPPTVMERAYMVGMLLGSVVVKGSTSLTYALWLILATLLIVIVSKQRQPWIPIALVASAIALPVVAQNLVSGLLINLPLWGTRHVAPTVALAALGLTMLCQRGIVPLWWHRVTSCVLLLLAVVSLTTLRERKITVMSDLAHEVRAAQDTNPIRVGDAYGDLSVLNYYLNRDCLDDNQLRVQYPAVLGPPKELHRSSSCVARSSAIPLPASDSSATIVYRTFVAKESQYRDLLVSAGWQTTHRANSRVDWPVVERLVRR